MRHYTDKPQWELPPLYTTYYCDGRVRTLEELLDGLDPEDIPTDQASFDLFLTCMGHLQGSWEEQKIANDAWNRKFTVI